MSGAHIHSHALSDDAMRQHVQDAHDWGAQGSLSIGEVRDLHNAEHGNANRPYPTRTEHIEDRVEAARARGKEQLRAADRLIGAQAFVRSLREDVGTSDAVRMRMEDVLVAWQRMGGHLRSEDRPAVSTVHPAAESEGEAYHELDRLLKQFRRADIVTPADIEAVIALAGLIRGDRGLTDVDPQDDPGPEFLRVEGARRFAAWLDQVGESRGSHQQLVTTWLDDHQKSEVEDDDAPKVEVFVGDKPWRPDPETEVERLREQLAIVIGERDRTREARAEAEAERDQALEAVMAAQGKAAELREKNDNQAGMLREQADVTARLLTAKNEAEARAHGLERTIAELRENRQIVHSSLVEIRDELVALRPRLVAPKDAVWDFLDWLRIKGWHVATSWDIGPEDKTGIVAAWDHPVLAGLVDGWHWARHGQHEQPEPEDTAEGGADEPSEEATTDA